VLVDTLASLSPAAWYNLGLAVIVLSIAVMAVIAYRAWAEAHEDLDPVSDEDMLSTFEQARAAGELDDEEYERLRRRLGSEGRGNPRP
jgi:hypothetical protein